MNKFRKLLPLAAVLAALPAAATTAEGVQKWAAGDFKGAVAEWMPQAARGDASALYNLGQAYRLGRGVPANAATASNYYRRAATRGHAAAAEQLGLSLYGNPTTKAEALRFLDQAARKNRPRAQYVLGVAHFNGDGVPKNWPLAYAYMLRANNAGIQQAAAALATMNNHVSPADRARGEALLNPQAVPAVTVAATPDAAAAPTGPGVAPARVAAAQVAPSAPVPQARPVASSPLTTRTTTSPAAPPAERPVAAAAAPRGYRVQIGAYSQREMANEAWVGLKGQMKGALADATPVFAQSGNMVRLQIGPYASRDEARKLCDRLAAAGRSCFVIAG
jgi:cell division septation protein DedD